jgi:hypothetical protein
LDRGDYFPAISLEGRVCVQAGREQSVDFAHQGFEQAQHFVRGPEVPDV